jgi:hypothetical protein
MSKENKQIITILLLIFLAPAGLVMMFVWQLWTKAIRYTILGIVSLLLIIYVVVTALIVGGGFWLLSKGLDPEDNQGKIYSIGDTAKANKIEFSVDDFATYETKNNFLDEVGSYCALSYTVKNTGDNELLLNSFTDFDLTADSGEKVGQLLSIGEEITTQPEEVQNFLGVSSEVLEAGQQESYFFPFACPEMETQYRLNVNINQYGEYILDDNFEPIKFDLSL